MAIQFDCPYCTATIRVPDGDMGAVADCPRCGTRYRVPTVAIPPQAASAAMSVHADDGPAALPKWEAETLVLPRAAPAAPPLRGPAEDSDRPTGIRINTTAEIPELRPADPVAEAYLRLKKRQRHVGIWGVLAIVIAVAGLAFAYWWKARANRVPVLAGEVLENATVTGVISERSIPLTPAEWANLRKTLEASPANLRSRQMSIMMEAVPGGLRVSLTPGKDDLLVAVPLLDVPDIAAVLKSDYEALEEPHRAALAAALHSLTDRIESASAAGRQPDLSEFGLSVGVNGLVGALGYHCQAAIERYAYSCVFEDRQGRLYFLVPAGTRDFLVQPRPSPSGPGGPLGRMRALVSVPFREVIVERKAAAEPSANPIDDASSPPAENK